MNLWLIGMMGSGKTSVGLRAGDLLRVRFVDIDAEVERRAGRSVESIWGEVGEAGFRRREARAIWDVSTETNQIIATGGGAVLLPANVSRMRGSGLVVWLDAKVESLTARLADHGGRPLLGGGAGDDQVAELNRARRPLYRAAAHVAVDSSGATVDDLAGIVEALWRS